MKIAVIGCGTIANAQHIPAYLANEKTEIKYFCDIIPERAEKAVKDYGCGIAVTDYKEVLADPEIEAVSVCTPNNMHSVISIDAMRAGKNVLCEKPAARTYNEALEMQKVQHETGKVLNIGVCNRFNNGVKELKKLIDDGVLGEVFHVYVSFRCHRSIPGLGGDFTTKAVAGGGALIDWGVHFLDIVMYCCGDPKPLTVSGEAFSKLGKNISEYVFPGKMWAGPPKLDGIYDVEDSVTAFIRTEGPAITVNGAWAQNINKEEMFIDFMGDKGGVRIDYYTSEFTVYTTKDGKVYQYDSSFEPNDKFKTEINEFIDCIKTGEKLSSHIDTNIITARMMQAIYDSSEEHKEISLG